MPCIAKRFARAKNYKGEEYVNHGYAMAVKTAGVKFVEIGEADPDDRPTKVVTAEEYEQAFIDNPDAKMVYWVGYAPPEDIALEDVIDIAHAYRARVIIDASNCLPPRENLYRFIDLGADVVCFSGGKGIQGPQGSGIIAGSQDIIDSIAMQSAPSHGIGRVAKVSKEEVVGQIASFIWWVEQDDEERMTEHHRKTGMLHIAVCPGLQTCPTPISSSLTKTTGRCQMCMSRWIPRRAKMRNGSSESSATAILRSRLWVTHATLKSSASTCGCWRMTRSGRFRGGCMKSWANLTPNQTYATQHTPFAPRKGRERAKRCERGMPGNRQCRTAYLRFTRVISRNPTKTTAKLINVATSNR